MSAPDTSSHGLARRLTLFDATMLVMGGIIGSGIFVTPAEVARHVGTPLLIVGVWILGGLVALAASFVYAELAARRPEVGGQYAYLRDAYGPMPAFLYGWALLLVIQSGGMAAVAITFARYFADLVQIALPDSAVAVAVLALLTIINCIGVRSGSNVQSALMVLKILAILALVVVGLLLAPAAPAQMQFTSPGSLSMIAAIGAAMTPVMFSYGGWQTASFVAGEMRDPRRDLARGLLLGVAGVVVLYTAVAFVCVLVLGPAGLAASKTPATDVMRLAVGERGATFIALGVTISTLGFLSQGMLTAPRVYFAMAEDGLFFRSVARINATTRVPVVAIVLQGLAAAIIAISGTFGQILSYVVSVDFIFFGLTGVALFIFLYMYCRSANQQYWDLKVWPDEPMKLREYFPWNILNGAWLMLLSSLLYFAQKWSEQRQQVRNIQIHQLETELKYLRNQVNPHFLFNGLNTIYGNIDMKDQHARNILLQFSDLLRYNLYEADVDFVDIEKEATYLENYVALQKARSDSNLRIELNINIENNRARIAPLLFIPFVENAFKFSTRDDNTDNFINISLVQSGNRVEFSCANSYEESPSTGGIGYSNVKRRLELLYKDKHILNINKDERNYYVQLIIIV